MEKNPYNHTNSRKIVLYKELHAWEKGRDKWIQSQNSWSAQSCTLCQQSGRHSHSRRQKYLHIHFPPLRVLLTTFFSLLRCPQSFIGRSSTFLSILKFVSVQKLLLYGLFWGGFFAINRRKIKREKKEKNKNLCLKYEVLEMNQLLKIYWKFVLFPSCSTPHIPQIYLDWKGGLFIVTSVHLPQFHQGWSGRQISAEIFTMFNVQDILFFF